MNYFGNGIVLKDSRVEEAIEPYLTDEHSHRQDSMKGGVFALDSGNHALIWKREFRPADCAGDEPILTFSYGIVEGEKVKINPGSYFDLASVLYATGIASAHSDGYAEVFKERCVRDWNGPTLKSIFDPQP